MTIYNVIWGGYSSSMMDSSIRNCISYSKEYDARDKFKTIRKDMLKYYLGENFDYSKNIEDMVLEKAEDTGDEDYDYENSVICNFDRENECMIGRSNVLGLDDFVNYVKIIESEVVI